MTLFSWGRLLPRVIIWDVVFFLGSQRFSHWRTCAPLLFCLQLSPFEPTFYFSHGFPILFLHFDNLGHLAFAGRLIPFLLLLQSGHLFFPHAQFVNQSGRLRIDWVLGSSSEHAFVNETIQISGWRISQLERPFALFFPLRKFGQS